MTGKTTFLKTLGLNAILAQTVNMSMAERYHAPFMKVISSIGRSEDIISGKSYYLAEVESILRTIRASESDTVHLFIVDQYGPTGVKKKRSVLSLGSGFC